MNLKKYFSFIRHRLVAGCFILTFGCASNASAQMLIQYKFDEGSGTTAANSGSIGSSANLTIRPDAGTHLTWAAPASTAFGGGSALVSDGVARGSQPGYIYGDGTGLNTGLSAFTMTMWVNLSSTTGTSADRLLSFSGPGSVGTGGFQLQLNTTTPTTALTLNVDGSAVISTANASVLGSWAFLAVTYDGTATSNNVSFYSGTTTTSAAALGSVRTLNKGAVDLITSPSQVLRIGNASDTNLDRSPAGMFDDVRVYSGVLNASSVEAVRLAAVPEPSTMLFLAVGVAIVAGIRLRRC